MLSFVLSAAMALTLIAVPAKTASAAEQGEVAASESDAIIEEDLENDEANTLIGSAAMNGAVKYRVGDKFPSGDDIAKVYNVPKEYADKMEFMSYRIYRSDDSSGSNVLTGTIVAENTQYYLYIRVMPKTGYVFSYDSRLIIDNVVSTSATPMLDPKNPTKYDGSFEFQFPCKTASGVTDYGISLNGCRITSNNKGDVLKYYDGGKKTVTLDDTSATNPILKLNSASINTDISINTYSQVLNTDGSIKTRTSYKGITIDCIGLSNIAGGISTSAPKLEITTSNSGSLNIVTPGKSGIRVSGTDGALTFSKGVGVIHLMTGTKTTASDEIVALDAAQLIVKDNTVILSDAGLAFTKDAVGGTFYGTSARKMHVDEAAQILTMGRTRACKNAVYLTYDGDRCVMIGADMDTYDEWNGKTALNNAFYRVLAVSDYPVNNIKITKPVNGKVVVKDEKGAEISGAKKGDKVTVVATPDERCSVASIKVVDSKGKEVAVDSNNSFIMPNLDVTVTVEFKRTEIKGICQMPYGMIEPGQPGYLIGIQTYEDTKAVTVEMLILDCTTMQWVYSTGPNPVGPENEFCLWTVWQPQYGYYWTLFRAYDKDGNLIDEVCYGFENI